MLQFVLPEIPAQYRDRLFVYIDYRPTGEPFYVGIGDRKRLRIIRRYKNKHHTEIIHKHPSCVRKIVCICDDREYANNIEQQLIARFGRSCNQSGILTNKSAGGDGYYDPSPETREAKRRAMTGKCWHNYPGANKAAVAAAKIVNQGNLYCLGYKHTPETRQRMSESGIGKKKSTTMRKKLSIARKERYKKVRAYLEATGLQIDPRRVTNEMLAAIQ